MDWGDIFSTSTLSGAATGAMPGLLTGNPWLAVGGGLLGAYGGAKANDTRDDAMAAQKKNLNTVLQQLGRQNQNSYAKYLQAIKQAQSYFGPAQTAWNKAYGGSQSMPVGQGAWGNLGVK